MLRARMRVIANVLPHQMSKVYETPAINVISLFEIMDSVCGASVEDSGGTPGYFDDDSD